jgi:hypothetical protein
MKRLRGVELSENVITYHEQVMWRLVEGLGILTNILQPSHSFRDASGDSSSAPGGSDAPVKGATTSQLARVFTSGVLVAQVTGTGRTFRVLSNKL